MVVKKKGRETSGTLEALRTGRHLGLLARQGIGPLAYPEARRARANLVSLRRHRFIDEKGRPHNIEEFLHGYCDLYAAFFLERNPDWIGISLRRRSNGLVIHAFAVRLRGGSAENSLDVTGCTAESAETSPEVPGHTAESAETSPEVSGHTAEPAETTRRRGAVAPADILAAASEYADARGITDNAELFFSRYRFKPSEASVEIIDADEAGRSRRRACKLGLTKAIAELYDTVNKLRY